jgi:hypothetical protein
VRDCRRLELGGSIVTIAGTHGLAVLGTDALEAKIAS